MQAIICTMLCKTNINKSNESPSRRAKPQQNPAFLALKEGPYPSLKQTFKRRGREKGEQVHVAVFHFPYGWTINSLSLLGGWLILKGSLHNKHFLYTMENNKNLSHSLLIFHQQLVSSILFEHDSPSPLLICDQKLELYLTREKLALTWWKSFHSNLRILFKTTCL